MDWRDYLLRWVIGIAVGLAVYKAMSANTPITNWDKLVDAVAWAESRMNCDAVGARGELGAWQFTRRTWEDVNRLRRGVGRVPFMFNVSAPRAIARDYAQMWLGHLWSMYVAEHKSRPSCEHMYAMWNMGYEGFKRRQFDLRRVPKVTKAGIARLREYLNTHDAN